MENDIRMRNFSPLQIREFMKRIPSHLYRMNYNEVKITCNEYFQKLPFLIVDFTNEPFFFRQHNWGGINVIYRARQIKTSNNLPHENISDISFIPESKLDNITNFGRVNKPQESMFYGSLNIPTACTEAVTKGNVFENSNSVMMTVGIWKFDAPLKLIEIPHSPTYFKKLYHMLNFKSEKIQLEHIEESNKLLKKRINNDFEFEKLM